MDDETLIVVGAGPVGCLTALRLQAQGRRVLLLERGAWDSPRGPLLNAFGRPVVGIFERFGAGQDLEAATVSQARQLLLGSARGRTLRAQWPEGGGRTFFQRDRLDRALRARVAAAGVPWLDRVSDLALRWDGARVVGARWTRGGQAQEQAAAWVLACDGAHSRLARAAGLEARPAGFHHVYRGQRYAGTAVPPGSFAFLVSPRAGEAVLLFADDAAGPGCAYVEVELRRHRGAPPAPTEGPVAEAVAATPLAAALVAGGQPVGGLKAVAIQGVRRERLVVPGLALLGDAAAVVDPIGSAGLFLGLLAAEELCEAVAGRSGGAWELGAWERRALGRVDRVGRFARLFRAGTERPWLQDAAFALLARTPRALRLLVDTYNGEHGYAEFFGARQLLGAAVGAGPTAQGR